MAIDYRCDKRTSLLCGTRPSPAAVQLLAAVAKEKEAGTHAGWLPYLGSGRSGKTTKKKAKEFFLSLFLEPKTRLELVTYALRMRRSTN